MTVVVTTSWDDGHVLDMRLAELLQRYAVCGTFYIAPRSSEVDATSRLRPSQLLDLAAEFEIGAHTLTHQPLPSLTLSQAESEVVGGKAYLENVIQAPIRSFCYPRGQYGDQHLGIVRRAGFSYARTTRRYVTDLPADPLQAATTTQAYRHVVDRHGLGRHVWNTRKISLVGLALLDWDQLAIRLFDDLLEADRDSTHSIYHLWGHSWELDARGEWQYLDRVLAHISGRAEVSYVTNAQLPFLPDVSSSGYVGS